MRRRGPGRDDGSFHHGIGYGDTPDAAHFPADGGLELARHEIESGFAILQSGDSHGFDQHCIRTKSDGRDVGQVLCLLAGPLQAELLDLLADDMAPVYEKPDPTWVAGALIALHSTERH